MIKNSKKIINNYYKYNIINLGYDVTIFIRKKENDYIDISKNQSSINRLLEKVF